MAFGLRPVQRAGSGPYNSSTRAYYIPSTDANVMYVGQAVVKTGTINTTEISTASAKYGVGTLSEVQRIDMVDGAVATGVIVSVELAPFAQSGAAYRPASTVAVVHVCDDPDAEFEIEANGAMSAGQIGLNAVMINSLTGSTATGLSAGALDTTSDVPAADASNTLLILGLAPAPGNAIDNSAPIVRVKINNHTEAHGALGI